jgi:hypothetical protein
MSALMISLLAGGLWLGALVFVLALCAAAKTADRPEQDRPGSSWREPELRRVRITARAPALPTAGTPARARLAAWQAAAQRSRRHRRRRGSQRRVTPW